MSIYLEPIALFHGKTMKVLKKYRKVDVIFITLIIMKYKFVDRKKLVMIAYFQIVIDHMLLEDHFGV